MNRELLIIIIILLLLFLLREDATNMKTKVYFCPVDDFDCPYYRDGMCKIGKPEKECDDYAYYNGIYDDDEQDRDMIEED